MKIEKIIQKMLQMPKEMAYKDVVRVLEYEGWRLRKTKGSSHRVFKKDGVTKIITLSPHNSKQKIQVLFQHLLFAIARARSARGNLIFCLFNRSIKGNVFPLKNRP